MIPPNRIMKLAKAIASPCENLENNTRSGTNIAPPPTPPALQSDSPKVTRAVPIVY